MATAAKNGRPGTRTARGASALRLVEAGSSASHDEGEYAARIVRDNAGAARLERRAPDDRPIDPTVPDSLPDVIAVSIPLPNPGGGRS
jgi:hypothetical protein